MPLYGLEITREFFIGILVSAFTFLAVSGHRKVKKMFEQRKNKLEVLKERQEKRQYTCRKLLGALADETTSCNDLIRIVLALIPMGIDPLKIMMPIVRILGETNLYRIPNIKKYLIKECLKDKDVLDQFCICVGKLTTSKQGLPAKNHDYLIENVTLILPLIASAKGKF